MTLIARLCALCAVCVLMQMAIDEKMSGEFSMIGGLLMIHLVISGFEQLVSDLLAGGDLMRMLDVLMQ